MLNRQRAPEMYYVVFLGLLLVVNMPLHVLLLPSLFLVLVHVGLNMFLGGVVKSVLLKVLHPLQQLGQSLKCLVTTIQSSELLMKLKELPANVLKSLVC
jgi:hypothetical protein